MPAPAKELLGIDEELCSETIDLLLEKRQLISSEISGEEFLFIPEMYIAEMSIAERLRNILKFTRTKCYLSRLMGY